MSVHAVYREFPRVQVCTSPASGYNLQVAHSVPHSLHSTKRTVTHTYMLTISEIMHTHCPRNFKVQTCRTACRAPRRVVFPITSTLRNSLGGTRYDILPPLDPLRGAGPPDDDGGATGSLPESMSSKHSSIDRVCDVVSRCGGVNGSLVANSYLVPLLHITTTVVVW